MAEKAALIGHGGDNSLVITELLSLQSQCTKKWKCVLFEEDMFFSRSLCCYAIHMSVQGNLKWVMNNK